MRNSQSSQCERILGVLQTHHGQWVSMPLLYQKSGAMAVHSRIAELRRRGHCIENKVVRQADGIKHSFYRWLPR